MTLYKLRSVCFNTLLGRGRSGPSVCTHASSRF